MRKKGVQQQTILIPLQVHPPFFCIDCFFFTKIFQKVLFSSSKKKESHHYFFKKNDGTTNDFPGDLPIDFPTFFFWSFEKKWPGVVPKVPSFKGFVLGYLY